jgi:hypothetical protein
MLTFRPYEALPVSSAPLLAPGASHAFAHPGLTQGPRFCHQSMVRIFGNLNRTDLEVENAVVPVTLEVDIDGVGSHWIDLIRSDSS